MTIYQNIGTAQKVIRAAKNSISEVITLTYMANKPVVTKKFPDSIASCKWVSYSGRIKKKTCMNEDVDDLNISAVY